MTLTTHHLLAVIGTLVGVILSIIAYLIRNFDSRLETCERQALDSNQVIGELKAKIAGMEAKCELMNCSKQAEPLDGGL